MSAELIGPYGTSLRLSDMDLSRLAYEYRNTSDQKALDAIAAEIERREKRFEDLSKRYWPKARPLSEAGEQPAPTPNSGPNVWAMVIGDMHERDRIGRAKYGTPLQPNNGRDALVDAYQECLDMAVYLKQAIIERDQAKGTP